MGVIPDNPEYHEAEDALSEYLGDNPAPKGGIPRLLMALYELSTDDFLVFVVDKTTRTLPRSSRAATAMKVIGEEVERRTDISPTDKELVATRIRGFLEQIGRPMKEARPPFSVEGLDIRSDEARRAVIIKLPQVFPLASFGEAMEQVLHLDGVDHIILDVRALSDTRHAEIAGYLPVYIDRLPNYDRKLWLIAGESYYPAVYRVAVSNQAWVTPVDMDTALAGAKQATLLSNIGG